MQTGCAGGYYGVCRTFQAQHDGQLARYHVDERGRHEKGRNTPRAALHVFNLLFFDAWQATNTRPDDGTDAIGVGLVDLQTRIAPGLHACGNTVMDESIHRLGFFSRDVLRNVEILDLTRDLGVERR